MLDEKFYKKSAISNSLLPDIERKD